MRIHPTTRMSRSTGLALIMGIAALGCSDDPASRTAGNLRVAVLPFTWTDSLSEERVWPVTALLAIALDQARSTHIVDAGTIARRWEREFERRPFSAEEAHSLAGELGADVVVTGSVGTNRGRLELSAVVSAVDGAGLGRFSAEGDPAEWLSVVNSLATQLRSRVLGASRDGGAPLEALTTASTEALDAYLVGLEHSYRNELGDAADALREAVAADSTFASAHMALADVLAWSEGVGSPTVRSAWRAAGEHRDRLPTRSRRRLTAATLSVEGISRIAADSARTYVRDHPWDPSGWFLLGEIVLHTLANPATPTPELVAPFQRIAALDPLLPAGYIHPLELALEVGDDTTFAALLPGLLAADSLLARRFRIAQRAAFGPPEEVGQAMEELLRLGGAESLYAPLIRGAFRRPGRTPLPIIQSLAGEEDGATSWDPGLVFAVHSSLGRRQAAQRVATAHPGLGALDAWRDAAVFAGFANLDDMSTPTDPDGWPAKQTAFLAALGTGALADAELLAAERKALEAPAVADTFFEGGLAWADLERGDTAAALERFDAVSLMVVARNVEVLRFRHLEAMAGQQQTRAVAVLAFTERRYWLDPHYEVLSHVVLAAAYAADGRVQAARTEYTRFLELLAGADADAPIQRRIGLVRERLDRLEPSP